MQKIILFFILILGSLSALHAQDAIYTANGSRLSNARITDLTNDRILCTIQQNDKLNNFSFQRQNVLVAFRKGNFLIIEKLNPDLARAKQELQKYLTSTAWQGKDYLLRAVPFEVIPAKIAYENETIVNYTTDDGKSASIPKGELIAILYNDGRHNLIKEPSEAAPLLADLTKPVGTSTGKSAAPKPQVIVGQRPTPDGESIPDQSQRISLTTPQASKLVLSETEYQYYRKKALDKVDEFASYLNIITDKSLSAYARNQAIEQAASLFMPAATIEVSSNKRPGARRYPIRTYLNNLKLLPYSSTNIEWTEIQYLKELSQAADGNYYGIITAQQTFIGQGSNTQYSDITPKNVRVKLERYHLTKDGQDDVKWNLLLGSIGISAQ